MRGKKAISARLPEGASTGRSWARLSREPDASACLRASRASGRLSCVQAEDITTSPPAMRRAARLTPKKFRIGVPAQRAPSMIIAA